MMATRTNRCVALTPVWEQDPAYRLVAFFNLRILGMTEAGRRNGQKRTISGTLEMRPD